MTEIQRLGHKGENETGPEPVRPWIQIGNPLFSESNACRVAFFLIHCRHQIKRFFDALPISQPGLLKLAERFVELIFSRKPHALPFIRLSQTFQGSDVPRVFDSSCYKSLFYLSLVVLDSFIGLAEENGLSAFVTVSIPGNPRIKIRNDLWNSHDSDYGDQNDENLFSRAHMILHTRSTRSRTSNRSQIDVEKREMKVRSRCQTKPDNTLCSPNGRSRILAESASLQMNTAC